MKLLRALAFLASLVACSAPSPQMLTLTTGDGAVSASTRETRLSVGGHEVRFALRALGRMQLAEVAPAELAREGVTLELRRGSLVEWWRPTAAGLEHGVNVAERPAGEGPLVLEIDVGGLRAEALDDDAIALSDGRGPIATYSHLVVLDADGQRVTSRMLAARGDIRIEVEDDDARYPLVVDPLVATYVGALLAPDAAANDYLGTTVALDGAGVLAIVGAASDVVMGLNSAGTARIFAWTGATWTHEAALEAPVPAAVDFLGTSVALSGDGTRALAGALGDDTVAGANAGSAHVFSRSGTTWTYEAMLVAPDAAPADGLGGGAALSADGTRALVGAAGDDTPRGMDSGSARVFLRTGTTWTHEATLVSPDAVASDNGGQSVALSANADRALVGADDGSTPGHPGAGAAWVFTRLGSTWSFEATLGASDGAMADRFGSSVALSADGSTALVGAPLDDAPSSNCGSARVFVRTGTAWSEQATLVASDGAVDDLFGSSVAISGDGGRAAIGVPSDDLPTVDAGSVRLFVRSGSVWTADAVLITPDAATRDDVGTDVALSVDGSVALVGTSGDSTPAGAAAGSARVFSLVPSLANGAACTEARLCTSGNCVDGVCCDTACGGGVIDCQACAIARGGTIDGTCTALAPSTASTVTCRAAVDLCDAPEVCGASLSCPADELRTTGTTCRPSTGACDIAETCNGASAVCPGDMVQPLGTSCGGTMPGTCAGAGVCNGASTICPSATVRPMGDVCLPAVPGNPCDVDDVCDGVTANCLPRYAPAATACGLVASDVCDAPDHCAGTSADCVAEFLVGVECRAAAGECDAPEVCLGDSASCPADAVESGGMVCRASTDTSCDPVEVCDGAGATCPGDVSSCTPGADAGIDAGAAGDGGPPAGDGGSGPDAGPPAPGAVGCACRGRGAGAASGPLSLAFVAGVALARSRRRAPSRR